MKKLMFLLTTILMINCVPAFAQDNPQDPYLCRVQAGTCLKRADVVQHKMKKLESDIQKGKKVYSAEDLKKIEDKLKEVEQMLDNLKAK